MTFVLILYFTIGGQSFSSAAVDRFKNKDACDAFAQRVKDQRHDQRPWVFGWNCVPAPETL